MKATTHLVFGLLLATLITQLYYFENPLLAIILVLVGSLLPDIDEKNSRFGRKVPVVSYLTKHRTFFHGILFCVFCFIALLVFVELRYALAFVAGFFGHVLLDALTPMGVKPFWPSETKINGFVKVGGVLEKLIFYVFVAVFVWLLFF